ncbi:MAG: hypothetical protein HQL59_04555 [Magnetococcales bacterium]|nr:hypothetical protein [Magnetococcales bacterium]
MDSSDRLAVRLAHQERRLAEMERNHRQRLQEEKQRQNEEQIHRLLNLIKAADAEGKPRYPHVGQVGTELMTLMNHLMQSQGLSQEEAFGQAYERAVWANPETRRQMQEEEARKAESRRQANSRKAVKEAMRAGGTPVRSLGTSQPGKRKPTMLETMGEAYDRVMGTR